MTGALDMNLWLSHHGIWYYRKITTLPCGRRKEIKKSLQTRDKLLACVRSRPTLAVSPVEAPETPLSPSDTKPVQAAKPLAMLLSALSDRYLKEKALSWATKEFSNQKNYIGSFIKALGAIQNPMVTIWLDSTSIIPAGMSRQH
jgi:hypothetical protein